MMWFKRHAKLWFNLERWVYALPLPPECEERTLYLFVQDSEQAGICCAWICCSYKSQLVLNQEHRKHPPLEYGEHTNLKFPPIILKHDKLLFSMMSELGLI